MDKHFLKKTKKFFQALLRQFKLLNQKEFFIIDFNFNNGKIFNKYFLL